MPELHGGESRPASGSVKARAAGARQSPDSPTNVLSLKPDVLPRSQGIEHVVEVMADSLYEAVAQGLRAFGQNEWVDDLGIG